MEQTISILSPTQLSSVHLFIYNSFLAPPSPPVSLTADFNSPTCSGAVQLAWTPGASDRDIEMYFLSLNGVLIASLGSVTSYNHPTTLQRDTEYTYSVVAMSCAGDSTETNATSISVGMLVILSLTFSSITSLLCLDPPSSPLVNSLSDRHQLF